MMATAGRFLFVVLVCYFCVMKRSFSTGPGVIMHTATLRAIGGSVSVTLPRQLLRTLGLDAGASVSVAVDGGRLVLTPNRPSYTLDELLSGMKPGDMPTDPGWECARPVRREVW